MSEHAATPSSATAIDLAEVTRLVAALEQDLARVRGGTQDVQSLRDEVEALRAALNASGPVEQELKSVHGSLEGVIDTIEVDAFKSADYIARIGRLLGLN